MSDKSGIYRIRERNKGIEGGKPQQLPLPSTIPQPMTTTLPVEDRIKNIVSGSATKTGVSHAGQKESFPELLTSQQWQILCYALKQTQALVELHLGDNLNDVAKCTQFSTNMGSFRSLRQLQFADSLPLENAKLLAAAIRKDSACNTLLLARSSSDPIRLHVDMKETLSIRRKKWKFSDSAAVLFASLLWQYEREHVSAGEERGSKKRRVNGSGDVNSIETVDLSDAGLSPVGMDALLQWILSSSLTTHSHFLLGQVGMDDTVFPQLLELIKQRPQLQGLSIRGWKLSEDALLQLWTLVGEIGLSHCVRLDLQQVISPPICAKAMWNAVMSHHTLRSVHFGLLDATSLDWLAESLTQALIHQEASSQWDFVQNIPLHLWRIPENRILVDIGMDAAHNRLVSGIQDGDLGFFVRLLEKDYLGTHSSMQSLSITHQRFIGDIGMHALCGCLQTASLVRLNFAGSNLQPIATVQHLCEFVKSSQTLKELYLMSTDISVMGAELMGAALSSAPVLESFAINTRIPVGQLKRNSFTHLELNRVEVVDAVVVSHLLILQSSLEVLTLHKIVDTQPETSVLPVGDIIQNRITELVCLRRDSMSTADIVILSRLLSVNQSLKAVTIGVHRTGSKDHGASALALYLCSPSCHLDRLLVTNSSATDDTDTMPRRFNRLHGALDFFNHLAESIKRIQKELQKPMRLLDVRLLLNAVGMQFVREQMERFGNTLRAPLNSTARDHDPVIYGIELKARRLNLTTDLLTQLIPTPSLSVLSSLWYPRVVIDLSESNIITRELEDIRKIADGMKGHVLSSVDLCDTSIDSKAILCLKPHVSLGLETLDLTSTQLCDEGLAYLVGMLESSPTPICQTLKLKHCQITEIGGLCLQLSKLTALTELDLSHNCLGLIRSF